MTREGSQGVLIRADTATSAASAARHQTHKQQLGLAALVSLIFLEVSGGPFGSEEAVQAAGPLLAILGFLIFPLIWSVPEALVTAELATAFPENSGYVVWVESAFGPFWGFVEGLFSWISGVTDNTIYPIMFIQYLKLMVPVLQSWWTEKLVLMVSSIAMTLLNYRGLDIVGTSSEVVTFLTLAPFVLLTLIAIPQMKPANWLQMMPLKDVNWSDYINVMFWNLNYWDSASTLAGEVHNPGVMFPRALLFAVQLVVVTYLVPLLVGVAVVDDVSSEWTLGYYGHVARVVGGSWLAWAVIGSAAVSQIGMFEAEMSSDSYQVLGMAERGYLPRVFGTRSRYGTPTIGILLSSIGVVTMLVYSFMDIVEMLNAVYCMAELLEFAAFVYLRIHKPDMHRVYRVPLGTVGVTLMLLPASILLVALLVLPIVTLQWHVVMYVTGVALASWFLYALLQLLRRLRLVAFEYNEGLEKDRWSAGSLAVSLTLLPAFAVGNVVRAATGLSAGLSAAVALSLACGVVVVVWGAVRWALTKETFATSPGFGSSLLSIPEDIGEAPLMRAYLDDSVEQSAASGAATGASPRRKAVAVLAPAPVKDEHDEA